MEIIVISFSFLVALTTGIVEVLKRSFAIETKFLPLLALIIGVVLSFLAGVTDLSGMTIGMSLLAGIAVGLSSSGLYDHVHVAKK